MRIEIILQFRNDQVIFEYLVMYLLTEHEFKRVLLELQMYFKYVYFCVLTCNNVLLLSKMFRIPREKKCNNL